MDNNWTPTSTAAFIVYAAGFQYDPSQDIIYSRMDALQRHFGYAYGYDKSALLMSAAIDCEPIFFEYDGKVWMIELWKGQYGLETGCEIGIYNRDPNDHSIKYEILDATVGQREDDPDLTHHLYFDCVQDSEMLDMSFTLLRNNEPLFSRHDTHWWLTGFKWGVFSDATDLIMDISINFAQSDMRNAFVEALQSLGYNPKVSLNNVHFIFEQPKTYQPRFANSNALSVVTEANQGIVELYNSCHFSNNDPNNIPSELWDRLRPLAVGYETFFRNALDTNITEITDWAMSILSLLGIIFSMDDSCAVEFSNQSNNRLILSGFDASYGAYEVPPAAYIPPHSISRLYLKDLKLHTSGSEGWVQYQLTDNQGSSEPIKFSFGCPFMWWYDNTVGIDPQYSNINFYAKSGSSDWGDINDCPKSQHPLYVRFVIND